MDMLIPLHALPARQDAPAFRVRKPLAPEHAVVSAWVATNFSEGWSSEASRRPVQPPRPLFIAQRANGHPRLLLLRRRGPRLRRAAGRAGAGRRQGIGAALLLACLHDMRTMGYGYAIAGHVSAPEFFRKVGGRARDPDSTPGIYADLLRR